MDAYAVALALQERNRTGKGYSVDSGLALTAGLLQSPYFLDYEVYRREDFEGVETRGYSAGSRLYEASDGWLYIYCPDAGVYGALLSALNFRDIHHDRDAIAAVIAGNTVEHWMQTLRPLSVSVSPNLTMEDYRNDPVVCNAGFLAIRDHHGWGSVTIREPRRASPPLHPASVRRLLISGCTRTRFWRKRATRLERLPR